MFRITHAEENHATISQEEILPTPTVDIENEKKSIRKFHRFQRKYSTKKSHRKLRGKLNKRRKKQMRNQT
jgi:hypothetical protein